MTRVDLVTCMEDEPVAWFTREGVTKREARRAMAEYVDGPRWLMRVEETFMRPADETDCTAKAHRRSLGVKIHDELYDGCCCDYYAEEGWQFQCDADHPAAVAVWRVDATACDELPLPGPLRRLVSWQRRKRYWLYVGSRSFRPVLWGGRPGPRRARWIDRLIIGWRVGYLPGDRWLTLPERRTG